MNEMVWCVNPKLFRSVKTFKAVFKILVVKGWKKHLLNGMLKWDFFKKNGVTFMSNILILHEFQGDGSWIELLK